MRALRSIALTSMLVLATVSGAARAAGPAAADTAAAALARRYYEDGVAAAEAKEWQKAYLAFAEAWRLKQHWQIAVNLGQAELKLGKFPEAAEHLAFYLRHVTEVHTDDIKQAGAWLEQARSKIGILRLNIAPPGAQVFVDGKLVGVAPIAGETFVESGWHAVEVRLNDSKTLRQVEAPMGRPVEVRLGVDGAVPTPLPEPATGTGGEGEKLPLLGDSKRFAVVVGGSALTLVNLIVGGATAAASGGKAGEQEKLCTPSCPGGPAAEAAWLKLEGERVGNANISVASFVIAGLAAAGTVTGFVLLQPKPAATGSSANVATLRLAPTFGGVVLSGEF